jgi:hypothetical protein
MGNTLRDFDYLFDDPITYKSLKFYPVPMRDFLKFQYFATCLLLEKDLSLETIKMTYLEFLYACHNEDSPYINLMASLLMLCTQNKELKIRPRYDKYSSKRATLEIDGIEYTADDFDEIKNLIAEQNMLDLPDMNKQKTVRDAIREAREYQRSQSGNKPASLEEEIVALAIYTGWELKTIYEMTIRKFIMALRRSDHIFHQEIYLSASLSGMVEWKSDSPVKHWLSDLNKDDSQYFKDVNEVKSDINFDNAKK